MDGTVASTATESLVRNMTESSRTARCSPHAPQKGVSPLWGVTRLDPMKGENVAHGKDLSMVKWNETFLWFRLGVNGDKVVLPDHLVSNPPHVWPVI